MIEKYAGQSESIEECPLSTNYNQIHTGYSDVNPDVTSRPRELIRSILAQKN
jgi:hypothetical protein